MKSPLRYIFSYFCFLLLASCVFAKDAPGMVMYWPNQDKPSLKVIFNTFREMGDYGGAHIGF